MNYSVRNTERVFMNETAAKVLEQEAQHPGDFSKIADLVRGDNYRFQFITKTKHNYSSCE